MNATAEISESILSKRIKNGDHTAFEIIFKRYYAGLVVFAFNIIQDRDAAEELVQAYFVRLWEKRTQLELITSLKSYLFVSIRNSSFNYLKHKKIEKDAYSRMVEAVGNHPVFSENIYMGNDLAFKLGKSVEALPERCREVFLLSRSNGLDNDAIAVKLGLSKRTVEKHISNALQIIKKSLSEYCLLVLPFLKF